jgi:hypothetical protein
MNTPRRFTALLSDTILAHGVGWTWRQYARRMPRWELDFWMSTPPVGRAMIARAALERARGATQEPAIAHPRYRV